MNDQWFLAALQDNVRQIALNIKQCVKQRNQNSETALMIAAANNATQVIKLLLPHEQRMQTNDGMTALMFAASAGHFEATKLLLPEVNFQLKQHTSKFPAGTCALLMAASNQHVKIVQTLQQFESDLAGFTSVHFLAITAASQRLKQLPLITFVSDKLGRTPIFYACNQKNTDSYVNTYFALQELGDTKVNFDCYGWSILHHAARCNNTILVKGIIEKQPYQLDVQTENTDYFQFLQNRAYAQKPSCLTQRSISASKRMASSQAQGYTLPKVYSIYAFGPQLSALQFAVFFVNTAVFDQLLNFQTKYQNKYGVCALFMAVFNGNLHFISLLRDCEFQLALTFDVLGFPPGTTALSAARKGCVELVPHLKKVSPEEQIISQIRNDTDDLTMQQLQYSRAMQSSSIQGVQSRYLQATQSTINKRQPLVAGRPLSRQNSRQNSQQNSPTLQQFNQEKQQIRELGSEVAQHKQIIDKLMMQNTENVAKMTELGDQYGKFIHRLSTVLQIKQEDQQDNQSKEETILEFIERLVIVSSDLKNENRVLKDQQSQDLQAMIDLEKRNKELKQQLQQQNSDTSQPVMPINLRAETERLRSILAGATVVDTQEDDREEIDLKETNELGNLYEVSD